AACPRPRAGLGRPPASAAAPGRGAPVRPRLPPAAAQRSRSGVDLRRAPGGRAGATAGTASPLRLGGALPRREPGGARGRAWHSAEDSPRDLRSAAQGRRAVKRALAIVPLAACFFVAACGGGKKAAPKGPPPDPGRDAARAVVGAVRSRNPQTLW